MMLQTLLLTSVLSGQLMAGAPCGCQHAPAGAAREIVARAWQESEPISEQHQKDIDRDREAGKKYSEEVLKEYELSENEEYLRRADEIGSALSKIANSTHAEVSWGDSRMNRFDYEFKVIKGEDVNAFSLPGGYIFIFEGLFDYAESDDEVAGVLAHEIAHAAFRHVATLQKERNKIALAQIPLILIAVMSGSSEGAGALQAGQLAGIAIGSGWSQKAEEAADYGGFQYILKSQYDPSGMVTFMERLAKRDAGRGNINYGIFTTHPPSRERAEKLIEHIEDEGMQLHRSKVTKSFSAQVESVVGTGVKISFAGEDIHTFYGDDAVQRAYAASVALNEFYDQVPGLIDLRVSSTGVVQGKGKRLFEITEADAEAADKPLEAAISQAKAALQTVIYRLSLYHNWSR